jgi:hypothetical protein
VCFDLTDHVDYLDGDRYHGTAKTCVITGGVLKELYSVLFYIISKILKSLYASKDSACNSRLHKSRIIYLVEYSNARQNKDCHFLLEEFVFVPVMDAVVVGVILEFERPE